MLHGLLVGTWMLENQRHAIFIDRLSTDKWLLEWEMSRIAARLLELDRSIFIYSPSFRLRPGQWRKLRHFYPAAIYYVDSSSHRRNGLSFSRKLKFDFLHIYTFRANDNKLVCVDIVCAKVQTDHWLAFHSQRTHSLERTRTQPYTVNKLESRAIVCAVVSRSLCCQFSSSVGEEVEPLLVIGPSQWCTCAKLPFVLLNFLPSVCACPTPRSLRVLWREQEQYKNTLTHITTDTLHPRMDSSVNEIFARAIFSVTKSFQIH